MHPGEASENPAETAARGETAPARVSWLHTPLARGMYYLCLALAAVGVNRLFHYGHALGRKGSGSPQALLGMAALWSLALAALVFLIALFVYEDLRWKGQLRRRSALFERILGPARTG
jgi:hypothetical protein